jgi:signal transduction histidine kinase
MVTARRSLGHSGNEPPVLISVSGEKSREFCESVVEDNARLRKKARQERAGRQQVEQLLRSLRNRIAEFSDRERRRIGQELHDIPGQQLTGAGLIAKSLQTRIEEQDLCDLSEDLKELAEIVRGARIEVRRLARGLCAVRMDSRGLMTALTDLVSSRGKRSGVHTQLDCDGYAFPDDDHLSNHLYHIAKEAVSNAIRHGRPERIVVGLHTQNGATILEVRDNGNGMPAEGPGNSGMGMHIMRCRADMIGARLTMDSSPGKGTTVRCTVRERKP